MKLLTATRWSDGTREHFMLRTDGARTQPNVTITWISKGEAYHAQMVVDGVSDTVIYGYIDAQVAGDFILDGIMGPISITDGSQSYTTPPTEKPPVPKIELVGVEYPALEVNHQFNLSTLDGYRGLYTFINRLADSGNSGLRLTKTATTGWSLPGFLSPEIIDEERLAELIADGYSEDSTLINRCYMLEDQLIFLRSVPGNTSAIRILLTEVYSWSIQSTIQSIVQDSKTLEQASYFELAPERSPQQKSVTQIKTPTVSHFKTQLNSIFQQAYPAMTVELPDMLRAYIPPRIQDRPADRHFSISKRIHNTIEEN